MSWSVQFLLYSHTDQYLRRRCEEFCRKMFMYSGLRRWSHRSAATCIGLAFSDLLQRGCAQINELLVAVTLRLDLCCGAGHSTVIAGEIQLIESQQKPIPDTCSTHQKIYYTEIKETKLHLMSEMSTAFGDASIRYFRHVCSNPMSWKRFVWPK